jgi:hypothetical protein
MPPDPVRDFLKANGYPPHLVKGGRAGLVGRWREFVESVEKGYKLNLEDYRNDLDLRAIIKRAKVEDTAVRTLDERLKKVLKPAKKRIWESNRGKPFWDFGYPSNASGELLADLKAEGLV